MSSSQTLQHLAKGITNGMPLGVLAGKEKYMKEFDKVFLSSTYAPEALTLAAASANIDFYREHNVIEKLWEKGELSLKINLVQLL